MSYAQSTLTTPCVAISLCTSPKQYWASIRLIIKQTSVGAQRRCSVGLESSTHALPSMDVYRPSPGPPGTTQTSTRIWCSQEPSHSRSSHWTVQSPIPSRTNPHNDITSRQTLTTSPLRRTEQDNFGFGISVASPRPALATSNMTRRIFPRYLCSSLLSGLPS
jgi:hypothetical protein